MSFTIRDTNLEYTFEADDTSKKFIGFYTGLKKKDTASDIVGNMKNPTILTPVLGTNVLVFLEELDSTNTAIKIYAKWSSANTGSSERSEKIQFKYGSNISDKYITIKLKGKTSTVIKPIPQSITVTIILWEGTYDSYETTEDAEKELLTLYQDYGYHGYVLYYDTTFPTQINIPFMNIPIPLATSLDAWNQFRVYLQFYITAEDSVKDSSNNIVDIDDNTPFYLLFLTDTGFVILSDIYTRIELRNYAGDEILKNI